VKDHHQPRTDDLRSAVRGWFVSHIEDILIPAAGRINGAFMDSANFLDNLAFFHNKAPDNPLE
jgi:hypothetical protein